MLKLREQKLIKVKAPFIDEISSLAIIKILDGNTHSTMLLKLKFMHNAVLCNPNFVHSQLISIQSEHYCIHHTQRNIK